MIKNRLILNHFLLQIFPIYSIMIETDKEFAEICKEYGNVVCGFSYVFSKELQEDVNGNLIENSMTVKEQVLPYKVNV